jgi:hypothetical protein
LRELPGRISPQKAKEVHEILRINPYLILSWLRRLSGQVTILDNYCPARFIDSGMPPKQGRLHMGLFDLNNPADNRLRGMPEK